MEMLCKMDIGDLVKGFYKAAEIFSVSDTKSGFFDGESAIDEHDLYILVERVVDVIEGHRMILADTYSYGYDLSLQVCYYNGNLVISKLLDIDGSQFTETISIFA